MAALPALFGIMMAAAVTGQVVEISPLQAVRRIGDDLQVLCKVPYPIDSCRMAVGTTSYILKPGQQDGEVIYHGQGLDHGECGAHIRSVREEWNGNISCFLPPQAGSIEITGTMRLIVAKPPLEPILESPPSPSFREGEVLTARCTAPEARPPAKITWFIDDEELLSGVHMPVVTSAGVSDLETVSVNVTRALSADDGGRTLACRVEHEALLQPLLVKRQLVVHYPPKSLTPGAVTVFGLQLNTPGRVNVSVRASPPPSAEWSVGEQRLTAPAASNDGTITALEPLHLGGGWYNISLLLSPLTKEAVERTYYLRVANDQGTEEVALRISTMDEPAGVELGTGAIVGIVVAVLVLLAAGSLVVFAFATDRWCFAGRRRDSTKSSGESSETESAVGGRSVGGRLAALGARVRAALPTRNKGHASDAEVQPQAEEKPQDDKVVYAQLALSESADRPPLAPPPTTEYAEIVYTEQNNQNNEQNKE